VGDSAIQAEAQAESCAKPQKAIARFTAQDGKVLQARPRIANDCGKGKKKKGAKTKGRKSSAGKGAGRKKGSTGK